jgi:hypothetical protein
MSMIASCAEMGNNTFASGHFPWSFDRSTMYKSTWVEVAASPEMGEDCSKSTVLKAKHLSGSFPLDILPIHFLDVVSLGVYALS